MNDDELKALLREAEAGIERTQLAPGELAGRVRRMNRRRVQRKRMVLALAPALVVGAVAATWMLWPSVAPVQVDQQVANATFDIDEIQRLRAEAESHERLARKLIDQRTRDRIREQARQAYLGDPLDEVREHIDVVAYRMILRADALQARMDPQAISIYRDVEQLFPNTSSAELARERLTRLGLPEGES